MPDDHARDRILIFEDTAGDGEFDTRKVFYDKLNLVSGLDFGFGGVWVGAAPHLIFTPDKDGDDMPDGPSVENGEIVGKTEGIKHNEFLAATCS